MDVQASNIPVNYGWIRISVIKNNSLTILGLSSAIVGIICLSMSSFSLKQFEQNQSLEKVVFILSAALSVSFMFVGRRFNAFLNKLLHSNSTTSAVVNLFFTLIVYALTFVVKYPRFNIHSSLTTSSCIVEERDKIYRGSQYNLFAVGSFSFLALLVSSKREQLMELGFSSMLLGLTISTSMEIPGTRGPNLWYMFGAALFCICLINLRRYIDSVNAGTSRNIFIKLMSEKQRDSIRNCLEICSAAVGLVFLCIGPFAKKLFEDASDLKASCFIIITLLLGYFMARASECVNYLADRCRNNLVVETMVKFSSLMIVSVVMFFIKYPRFQIYSKHIIDPCTKKTGEDYFLPHGNLFDLFSVAAFNLYALTISAQREETTMELGIFHFLLELTMDASIETLENKVPNLKYIVVAAIYCLVLIFSRIYLEHYSHSQRASPADLNEILVQGNEHESGDVAAGEERSTETVVLLTKHEREETGLRRRIQSQKFKRGEGLIEDRRKEEGKLQGRNDDDLCTSPFEDWCEVPQPPTFTVGLDAAFNQSKTKLLDDDTLLLSLKGKEGIGKTTLAVKLCEDDAIKEKFKNNIVFVRCPRDPNLKLIVQKLYEQYGYQVPSFEDKASLIWLERLMSEIGQRPLLLVLDNVWDPTLVKNFRFRIGGYKILTTSRLKLKVVGTEYVLQSLNDEDAMTLFRHHASLEDGSSNIPDVLVEEVLKKCRGNPLALKLMGSSLSGKSPEIWQRRLKYWDPLAEFPGSFNIWDEKDAALHECFKDLILFPEARRIAAAALIDIWTELYKLDEAHAIANLFELSNRNLVNFLVTRKKVNKEDDYYNEHFVTQHDTIRRFPGHRNFRNRKHQRLIVNLTPTNSPNSLRGERLRQREIKKAAYARLLAVSTDEIFQSNWSNMQLPKAEVLLLNFQTDKTKTHALPEFLKNTSRLKVLIITNYGFFPIKLSNFKLLGSLTNLKRIRLERISISSLTETPTALKQLLKLSLFTCKIGEAFSCVKISELVPNLVEMNIDYCNDLVELPAGLCEIISLKKLSITHCHKLSSLPEEIGNLVNLEVLRLRSCIDLEKLPDSICNLCKISFLDISDCFSIRNLPENFGKLCSLTKLNMRNCSNLQQLPRSILYLKQLDVA